MTTVSRQTAPQTRTQRSEPTSAGQAKAPATQAPASSQAPKANTAKAPGTADTFKAGGKSDKPALSPTEFRDQANQQLERAGVPADQRKRVTDHLKSLSGAELERETRLLQHALESPNADRAIATYDRLLSMSKESPKAAQRLTPEIREALVNGVADRRTSSEVGQEGILGQRQAEQAARSLIHMPQEQYDQARSLLSRAGQGADGSLEPGADAGAERALILKSIAARGDRLRESPTDKLAGTHGQKSEASRAMDEIRGFAQDVRGMDRTELIRTTSALDLEGANTSTVDPDNLRENNDTRGDNDGLYQRWEHSCGPTTAQMTRAEADPVYARQLHKDGLHNADPNSATAREQRQVLEKERFLDRNGKELHPTQAQIDEYHKSGTLPPGVNSVEAGEAVSRLGHQARQRLVPQLALAQSAKQITGEQRTAIKKLIDGQPLTAAEQAQADAGLAAIRKRDGGHPTTAEVNAMRDDAQRGGDGMRLNYALSDITSQSTGIDYKANWVGGSGLGDTQLKEWDKRLEAGQDVPIRVSDAGNNGGHFMLVSDVRGEGDGREYLVSDPWSGRTSWVSHDDLVDPNSGFLSNQFGLGWSQVSHYYTE